MMVFLVASSPPSCVPLKFKAFVRESSTFSKRCSTVRVRAFLFKPSHEPIIKEALKEPVAFMGGIFAGLLRLDLNDDPLKEWVTKTVEAAGITVAEIDNGDDSKFDDSPEQIEIE